MPKDYFLYDGLVSRQQFSHIFEQPKLVDLGFIQSARLSFMGTTAVGKATITRTDQATDYVPGIVVHMCDMDAQTLERIYAESNVSYKKVRVDVHRRNGTVEKYTTFVASGEGLRRCPPAKEYFWSMITAYNERKFDKSPLYASLVSTLNSYYETYDDVGAVVYLKPMKARRGGRPENGSDIREEIVPDRHDETGEQGA